MHRTRILALAALSVLLAGSPGAEAAPLLPGDTLSPVPPLAPPQGSVAGHVDATFQSASGPFTGRLSEDVIRKADNTLAFCYQLSDASAPPTLLTGAGRAVRPAAGPGTSRPAGRGARPTGHG